MRVQDLQQAGHGLANSFFVACGQVGAESELLVDCPYEALFAHLAQGFGEVVGYEAEMVREQSGFELWCLPAGQVVVQPVEEGRVDHGLGQVSEQVGLLHEIAVRATRVPYEHDGRLRWHLLFAPGEGAGLHVVP